MQLSSFASFIDGKLLHVVCIFEAEVRRSGKIGIWTRGLSGGRTQHDSVEMRALLESAKNAYKVIHWQRKLVRRDAEFCRGYRSPSLSGDDVQDDKVVVMDADEEGEKE
ncbi:hypothetical protein HC256_008009 [Beauveria bassiana]|nr:hypothetical protein HC256_008009 [Beauveria bassiana]